MPGRSAGRAVEADLAGEYFEQLSDRYERAATALGGAGTLDLEMAGLRLRLRYAGAELRAGLLAPFEHLACREGGDPDLTISLFDTASSGIEPPAPLWQPIVAAPGTNPVARLRSERACVLAAAGIALYKRAGRTAPRGVAAADGRAGAPDDPCGGGRPRWQRGAPSRSRRIG